MSNPIKKICMQIVLHDQYRHNSINVRNDGILSRNRLDVIVATL